MKETGRLRFGDPCAGGCDVGDRNCPTCPAGSHCSCGTWHPVPNAGFCYHRTAYSDVGCFHRCLPPGRCVGELEGECPSDSRQYEQQCARHEKRG
ncbi:hypothetical protein CYMTET_43059 [Cymbomonas tetramitiformis]|uniref:Uncharacterized protein n=1 Tax=Cymbomonas tetramitiformis TaxID=36881 RepID=A0AAE0C413_9CHLO|nr:hypothetical protein CYMTET_43059 [Cymbomonas tetramitiformis]